MDELLGSPIDVNKYTNLIEKIKKNKIFIDFLKLNHSNIDIETLPDDAIYDMFKQYMVSNKENISSQSVNTNTNTNTPSKLNINMNSLNTIVSKNYNQADKYIKNMLTPQNLIIVNGRINKIPLRILVNTGATHNFIYKNKVVEAKIDIMIDLNLKNNTNANVYGTLWYYEIDIEIKKNLDRSQYTTLPINLIVLEDNKTNFRKTSNSTKSYNNDFDMIVGINFMRYYGLIINFNTNTLEFDNNIIINYD